MCTEPHWTTYLAALLTPIVAIFGSYIAYKQWHLARNKLKHDLFNKRFFVFEAAISFITSIMTSGRAEDEAVSKFMIATREAKWLLDAPIAEYLDKQLYEKAIDLQTLNAELKGLQVGDERTENIRKQAEIKKWLAAQLRILDEKFSPYLKLKH
jgi:hypothetical protein